MLCHICFCLPASRVSGPARRAHHHVWLEWTCSNRHQGMWERLLSVWCSSTHVCQCRLTGLYAREGQCYMVCCHALGPRGPHTSAEQPRLPPSPPGWLFTPPHPSSAWDDMWNLSTSTGIQQSMRDSQSVLTYSLPIYISKCVASPSITIN